MNKLQLYLNDFLIDLSDDNPLALSFAINNLADVKNQNSNTSNQFKIPLTVNNRKVLGIRDTVGMISNLPYSKYTAKIIQDGIEILPIGFAELNGIDDDFASITVLSGNVDFFDLLTGKIYEMGLLFSPYQHLWNMDNVFNSQSKTEGWLYPIIDYGDFTDNFQDLHIDVRNLRPSFYLHTAIELIGKITGFEMTGSLLNIPLYKKLIIAFANDDFEHGTNFSTLTDNLSSVATNGALQPINKDIIDGRINFNSNIVNTSGSYNPSNSVYTAKEVMTIDVALKYTLQCNDVYHGGSQPSILIRLIKNANGVETEIAENRHYATDDARSLGRSGDYIFYNDQELTAKVSLNTGDQLYAVYHSDPGTNRIQGSIYGGAKISFTNNKSNVVYGQHVQAERIFPDITQKDLLKDTFQKFGIICSTDNYNRKITFATFADIVSNIPIAHDWSQKVVDQGKSVTFKLGDYAQNNYMIYKEDDAINPLKGKATIVIKDQSLPFETTLIESVFAPTNGRIYFGGTCPQIIKIDITDDTKEFKIKTSPRILIDRKFNLLDIDKTITLTDGITTRILNGEVSIPYFDELEESLSFDYLKKHYYHELEQVLTQTKKIVRYFMLSAIDIANLNLLTPIYLTQESAYFYISSIENYVKGKQTKVTLIRL